MVGDYPFIAVYLMADRMRGTLYVGVTSQLVLRAGQHRDGAFAGFTKRYGLKRLVWYERHERMESAIQRETSLKRWPRQWKINLIERENPLWEDLYEGMCAQFEAERSAPYVPDPDVLAKVDALRSDENG